MSVKIYHSGLDFLSQKSYNVRYKGDEQMKQGSTASRILEKIQSMSHDQVFVTCDFLDLGEYNTVRQALLRLKKSGHINDLMRGVYYRPCYSEQTTICTLPSPVNTANALARKFNWSIVPYGENALSQLGLISHMPAKLVYISDGPYYEFQSDKFSIEFKHRGTREISGMSATTALIIQGLKALGRGNITELHIETIRRRLSEVEKALLQAEARQSNIWIYEMVKRICVC